MLPYHTCMCHTTEEMSFLYATKVSQSVTKNTSILPPLKHVQCICHFSPVPIIRSSLPHQVTTPGSYPTSHQVTAPGIHPASHQVTAPGSYPRSGIASVTSATQDPVLPVHTQLHRLNAINSLGSLQRQACIILYYLDRVILYNIKRKILLLKP